MKRARWAAPLFALAGATALATAFSLASCSVDLGATPFACGADMSCPDGYTCEATECVAPSTKLSIARPLRITYINSAEMYWFASPKGGATLVVNDGFSPGARALYEIHVAEDGTVSNVTTLLGFTGEFPVSSAVVALDDGRYGVLTLNFPGVDESSSSVQFHALSREAGSTQPDTVLFKEDLPYVGGYEPAYIAAVIRNGTIITALTDPSSGGHVQIESHGLDGSAQDSFQVDLPMGVLPLSGDCLLWNAPDGSLTLRLGLDTVALFRVDLDAHTATPITEQDGLPIYAFQNSVAWLETADDGSTSYVLRDLTGNELGRTATANEDGLEPYTGVPDDMGALIAPLSADDDFKTLDVALVTATDAPKTMVTFDRPSADALYSARAFETNGHVYAAWTSFHESLMDLWVGVKTP